MKLAHLEFGGAGIGGATVVLLHGFPLDARVWKDVAETLAGSTRVVLVDLPGFGRSPLGGAASIDDYARELRAFLLPRGLLPCVLGGLSMGGYVALAYHRLFPAELRGLILVDSKAAPDAPEVKADRDRMVEVALGPGAPTVAKLMLPKMLSPGAAPDVSRQLMDIMLTCPPATMARALLAMRDRPDYSPDLPRTRVPLLVICGEHDAITPPADGRALAATTPTGTFALIANAGHMTPIEQPDQVANAIATFVADLPV